MVIYNPRALWESLIIPLASNEQTEKCERNFFVERQQMVDLGDFEADVIERFCNYPKIVKIWLASCT